MIQEVAAAIIYSEFFLAQITQLLLTNYAGNIVEGENTQEN